MMDERKLEEIVRQVLREVASKTSAFELTASPKLETIQYSAEKDYPLAAKHPDLLKTFTGKKFEDITLESVMGGEIAPDDLRITAETLHLQAQIAEAVGRKQLAQNLRRAAELTHVPDERILEIYTALRPYRSTKAELLDIAHELQHKYNAPKCAALVCEAAEVYERRKRLKGME